MNNKTLTGKLRITVLLLGIAMIALWTFFYFSIRTVLNGYTLKNMEQTVAYSITQMNTTFLEMEQINLAIMQEEEVLSLFEQKDNLSFHNKASEAEGRLQELILGKNFLSSIILYQTDGNFYRLRGNISNTGVERLLYLVGMKQEDYICIKLDNEDYIAYISRQEDGTGGMIMLMKETEVERLLSQFGRNDMQFVLTAGEEIVAESNGVPENYSLSEFQSKAKHIASAQVGYTPFQLWVSYTERDKRIQALFLFFMALMAFLLLFVLQVFLHFWRKNFFTPIQTVIDEVEGFESGKGKLLPFTGQEHFDGLIRGINDMAERIETKDKAMIVSLKKQINAHFIFNILNIIKALAEKGENEKAGELCNRLSLLLRYANEGESYINGMEEFYTLQNYVEIMDIRYPNRFTAEIEMEDFLENIELPRMLLQPIVENSIVHGLIAGNVPDGVVRVYASVEADKVYFTVEDNGAGMSEDVLEHLRKDLNEAPFTEPEIEGISHVALVNIERRIKSYFGKEYGIMIDSEEGRGTKVTVLLPGSVQNI